MNKMETPFNMMIVGMTGCGKSYYLLEMLEKEYFGHFDYIFLICPTYFWNKTYQNWAYKDSAKFYPLPCDQSSVDNFLKYIVDNFKGTSSLIILDDCAATQAVKNRVSELVNLAFSARHYTTLHDCSYTADDEHRETVRENISKLVTFYNPSKKDMQTITDEFLNVTKEEVTDIVQKLKNNKYARLEILLRHPFTHDAICPPNNE